jgi:hypothetical protein
MDKSIVRIGIVAFALFVVSCSDPTGTSGTPDSSPSTTYHFPAQILVAMPFTSNFTPSGGGAAVGTQQVAIGLSSGPVFVYSGNYHSSDHQSMPEIADGLGNTWIPVEMYITGANFLFYMKLQVSGDPSRTQLVTALLQEHTVSGVTPKNPPYDLRLAPVSELPGGLIYSLASNGNMQPYTEDNVGYGPFSY